MTDQTSMPACMGCNVQPNFAVNTWGDYYNSPFTGPPNYMFLPNFSALTDAEKEVLFLLKEAYNKFIALDKRSNYDNSEFVAAIHQAQQLIAIRVARRVDPDVWNQPE